MFLDKSPILFLHSNVSGGVLGVFQQAIDSRCSKSRHRSAYQLRREFEVSGPARRARLYICTLGYHEITLNGEKVDDHRLEPGFSHYSVRADEANLNKKYRIRKGLGALIRSLRKF